MKVNKPKGLPVADAISEDQLITETEDEIFINLEEIKQGFIASGHHLYSFIMNYRYPREVNFDEKITIFCQMVGMYESEFEVTDDYMQDNDVEYAVVRPGEQSEKPKSKKQKVEPKRHEKHEVARSSFGT